MRAGNQSCDRQNWPYRLYSDSNFEYLDAYRKATRVKRAKREGDEKAYNESP